MIILLVIQDMAFRNHVNTFNTTQRCTNSCIKISTNNDISFIPVKIHTIQELIKILLCTHWSSRIFLWKIANAQTIVNDWQSQCSKLNPQHVLNRAVQNGNIKVCKQGVFATETLACIHMYSWSVQCCGPSKYSHQLLLT